MENIADKDLSAEQSLQLITSMIQSTRQSLQDSSIYFLIWGWGVLLACVIQYSLKVGMNSPYHPMAWLVLVVVFVAQILIGFKRMKKRSARTFVEDANIYLWTAVGLGYFISFLIFGQIGWDYCFSFYILFYGIGTYVSGKLIQFKPLFIGGLLCFPIAVATVYVSYDMRIIMLGVAILISYIIPGHLLRMNHQKQIRGNV
jgi:hypothetical protein